MTRKGGNPDIRSLIRTGRKTPLGKLKSSLNRGKVVHPSNVQGRYRKSLLNDTLLDSGFSPTDPRVSYIKTLFSLWVREKTNKELKEILEIEEILSVVKGSMIKHIYNKLLKGEQLDVEEMQKLKFMVDSNEKLHKMKHGEKKEIRTVDFKDVMNLYHIKKNESNRKNNAIRYSKDGSEV